MGISKNKTRKIKHKIRFVLFVYLILFCYSPSFFNYIAYEASALTRRIQTPSTSDWDIALPSYPGLGFKGATAIGQTLEELKNNWYWNVLSEEAKTEIRERLGYLQNLNDFVRSKYGSSYSIRSIIVKGSYLWGANEENKQFIPEGPHDVDITVIVAGDVIRSFHESLTPDEVVNLFGVSADRYTDKMDVKILGEGALLNYFSDYDVVESNSINGLAADIRAMSERGSGVNIAGSEWFNEEPPASLWLESIDAILVGAESLFLNFIDSEGEHYFSDNVQKRYFELSERLNSDGILTISEEEEYKRLYSHINFLQFGYYKAIKRVMEGSLMIHHFLTQVQPEWHDSIRGYEDVLSDNPFICPNVVDTINEIIVDGVDRDLYGRLFSEAGIVYFMDAIHFLRHSIEQMRNHIEQAN